MNTRKLILSLLAQIQTPGTMAVAAKMILPRLPDAALPRLARVVASLIHAEARYRTAPTS